jgi:hypothetical protein
VILFFPQAVFKCVIAAIFFRRVYSIGSVAPKKKENQLVWQRIRHSLRQQLIPGGGFQICQEEIPNYADVQALAPFVSSSVLDFDEFGESSRCI